MKKVKNKESNKENNNLKIKLIIHLIILTLFIFLISIFLVKSFNFKENVLSYSETGVIDYKVYLKENDFYPNNFLDKDMIYVSNLIDYIDIDFNYNFEINENIDVNFVYNIIGQLVILDESGKKTYFVKEYDLYSSNKDIQHKNVYNINQNIKINYDEYNSIANEFKSTFGVETTSYLRIYLEVKKSSNNEIIKFNDANSKIYLDIPLSEKSINMTINSNNLNQTKNFIKESVSISDNIIYIVLTCIFILTAIVVLSKILYLITLIFPTKKNAYDKYVNKIIKEYDRLIAETNYLPIISDYNLILISNFKELIDVRDNLKKPIMHYIVKEHSESIFYIIDDINLYLVKITNKDLEKNEKNF